MTQPQDFAAPRGVDLDARWLTFLGVVLVALTLPTLKLPIVVELRIGQLLLIGGFAWLAMRDLVAGRLHWGLLLGLVGAGLLLCIISYASPYTKVKQVYFFVKYLFLFPAAFYLSARVVATISPARLAATLEWVLLIGCGLAVFLNWFPIPLLIHERPEGLATGLKGSFWEQGSFAFFIGLFLVGSLSLRVGYQMWPRQPLRLALLYVFALGCAIASLSVTIWLALVLALVTGGLAHHPPETDRVSGGRARRWSLYFLIIAAVAAIALLAYNAWLPVGDKLITADALQTKWQDERGAALRTAWKLILEHPWLGHGFGFVEAFFGTRPLGIVGLGSGVAQIFNSYVDVWVSVGVFGLAYALGMLWLAFDRRVLFCTLVVAYVFVFANINPMAQTEYYHIFLGAAFALSRWHKGGPKPSWHSRRQRHPNPPLEAV
ncbi:MAG: O-antigen ligase family protein [Salinisphaera sp.]|nr:O-antigen ligase family protein [Salinisphaera sp.]